MFDIYNVVGTIGVMAVCCYVYYIFRSWWYCELLKRMFVEDIYDYVNMPPMNIGVFHYFYIWNQKKLLNKYRNDRFKHNRGIENYNQTKNKD